MNYLRTILILLAIVSLGAAQPPIEPVNAPKDEAVAPVAPAVGPANITNEVLPVDKRIAGVLPNYRSAEQQAPFERLSVKQKFTIATKDSFDYPVLGTTAIFTGLSQLEGSNNALYGQGMKGFAHRYAIQYVDQVVGNYFPEAIIPSLFHVDPRYYRKGTGSLKSRLAYAVTRIVICKNDNGNNTLNVNEFIGNPLAAIAASAYHPHQRTVGEIGGETLNFMESDAVGQILREFWPDIKRKFKNRHHGQ